MKALLFIFLLLFTGFWLSAYASLPNTDLMHFVHRTVRFGASNVTHFNWDAVAVARILIDKQGSCGHQSAVLAYLLALKGQKTAIVDLMTCGEKGELVSCGHTIVYAEGAFYDATNDKVYYDTAFFNHSWEKWIGRDKIGVI